MKKRILKSEKILNKFFAENENFYIGLPFEEALRAEDILKYGIGGMFNENKTISPLAKGSVTKQNTHGKYIRKLPEEKTTKQVRISYVRMDGAFIDYVRDFHVYVKILSHKFNSTFKLIKNKHGQELIVSQRLSFSNTVSSNVLNTHTINLFLEIFGTYEIYTGDLEPAIVFDKIFHVDLLPSGTINDENLDILVQNARKTLKREEDVTAYMKRLKIIQEYNPEIVAKGPNGFFGYIVFEFKELGIVMLESMYMGNATYVFDINNYERLVVQNKQDVLQNNLAIKRFFHHGNWEENLRNYFLTMKKAA